jgi:hypothetical protein
MWFMSKAVSNSDNVEWYNHDELKKIKETVMV